MAYWSSCSIALKSATTPHGVNLAFWSIVIDVRGMIHICTTRLPLRSTIKTVEHCIKQWHTNIAITDVPIISLSCLSLSKSIGKAPCDRLPIASRERHERILPCYNAQYKNSVCFFVRKESSLTDSFVKHLLDHRICSFTEVFETSGIHVTVNEIHNVSVLLSMFRPIKCLLQDDCVWSTILKHTWSWRRPLIGQIIVKVCSAHMNVHLDPSKNFDADNILRAPKWFGLHQIADKINSDWTACTP